MLKALDIALKDLTSSFRSATALVFMFVVPLLVTGMFYLMFGNIAQEGEFNLPRTSVVVVNLDRDAPRLGTGSRNVPGGIEADTLSELVVEVLSSEQITDLIAVYIAQDADSALAAVDNQQAQVAVIIPDGFSQEFIDLYGQSTIEFYQDPTLTLGPMIVKSILSQFMDGLSGVKVAMDIALDQPEGVDYTQLSQIVEMDLDASQTQDDDLSETLLEVYAPGQVEIEVNPLLRIVGPIMGGMMIFYAFFTGANVGASILKEDEEGTLPRLFTTPTAQSSILSGKFLSVFLTVLVQTVVLIVLARLIFRIDWGDVRAVVLLIVGIVCIASSFGIFINSLLKSTKQGGVIFGGVITFTGMLGMISVFALDSPSASRLGNTVSLLVPQGWAARGLLQSLSGEPLADILITTLVMLAWSAAFFVVGVYRFNRRYA
jgi:ABC-2 type transport system permease protein